MLGFSVSKIEAQAVQISGRVLDSINRDPVQGATVRWNGGNPSTTTDAQGNFTLSGSVTSIGSGANSPMRFDTPYFQAGKLRFETGKSRQTVNVSVYNAQGGMISSHRFDLTAGIQNLSVLPEGKGFFLGFVLVQSEGESYRFKVMHQGGPVPLTKAEYVAHTRNVLARSAAGTVNATLAGGLLNPGSVAATADTMTGLVVLMGYPVRPIIGVGARPPWGTTMLFDGSQGRAAGITEMQTKWRDWPRFSTPSPIMFRIARDPQYLADTNRVTMQSCCNTLWGYDDIQATVGIFQDVQVHAEFIGMGAYDAPNYDPVAPNANATDPFASGQPGYVNSGVYVASRYEVQIQSFALTGLPGNHDMGSIVDDFGPTSNQNRANGVWQAYDMTFRMGRFTGTTMTTAPYMTVWWNGVQVHNNRVLSGRAAGLANHSGEEHLDPVQYGLKLQSEGRDVRYRNVWVKKLTLPAAQTNFGF